MKNTIDFFKHFLSRIRHKGSFAQSFAITFSGNIIAQAIGFLFTPFVARIYGPESYGVFSVFIATVNNIAIISTLQYPSGYVAAENDSEFFRILKITFIALISTTVMCCVVIWFWGNQLISFFNVNELASYLFWIPIYLLLMGADNILLGWNIRLKQFKRGAFAKIFSTTLSRGTAVLFGLLALPSATGLIFSNLLVYPIEGISKLSKAIRQSLGSPGSSTIQELKSTFLKFKGYALYVTPGIFIVNTAGLLPIYYFSHAFGKAVVGQYALSNGIVNVPLALIVNSSLTVFLQKAAETLQNNKDEARDVTLSLYKKLFLLCFPALVLLAISSKFIFTLVFGSQWELAGVFASFLCVPAVLQVVQSPLAVMFRLTNKEHINLSINLVFLGIKFLGLWIGVVNNSVTLAIVGFCFASILSSFVSMFAVFKILEIPSTRLFRDFVLVLLFGLTVMLFHTW